MFGNEILVGISLEMEILLRKVPKILWFRFSIEKCLDIEVLLKKCLEIEIWLEYVWKWKFG